MGVKGKILLTGATGYIGGQLAPRLLAEQYAVRAMARTLPPEGFRPWQDQVEFVKADPLRPETLPPALNNIQTAFYLIHSMTSGVDFCQRDIQAARQFGQAAKAAGIERIIYLGGLGQDSADLSEHLRSRHETGAALREAGVPVTEFRAAIIVGAGSISFEMVRYLTERLPVMICPRWVFTKVQPIAIDDVLAYLVAALAKPETAGQIIEIGGRDVLTYGAMMTGYGQVRGLRRFLIRVPVLTPRLSSYWIHWVTPIRAPYARPLIEGLRNEVIVRDDKARRLMPEIRPVDYATAVGRALDELTPEHGRATWNPLGRHSQTSATAVERFQREGMIVERRHRVIAAPAAVVFRSVSGLGGPSLRQTRPERDTLHDGDIVDSCRMEKAEENRVLRYRIERRLPGKGWLQFQIQPLERERCELTLSVFFAPKGLAGLIYWYALYPIHALVFARLLRRLAREAETARPSRR